MVSFSGPGWYRRDVVDDAKTAAFLVIGNELLSGKIQDENVPVLARELFALGIRLRRVVFCPDEVETIAADLQELCAGHDYVFTSGGVGPTHDDVTALAVARAFGRPLVHSPEIEALLRAYLGERITDHHLRMAQVPEGTRLVRRQGGRWPTVRVENVFVLPGLPEVFRLKLPTLREHLAGAAPFVSRAVRAHSDEAELAPLLDRLDRDYPGVAIGSYPRLEPPFRVTVTFDGREPGRVAEAVDAFLAAVPAAEREELDEWGRRDE